MELPTCPASALSFLEELIRNYRSLDCSCCQKHLVFQNRLNPNVLLCSAKCVANYNGDPSSDTTSVCSVSSSTVQTDANCSKLSSNDLASDLLAFSNDLPSTSNGFSANQEASSDLKEASSDLQEASNDLQELSNDLPDSLNDPVTLSNDLETPSKHSDSSSNPSAKQKKSKNDPSKLFKRSSEPKNHFRSNLPDFHSRFSPAQNSSSNVSQNNNKFPRKNSNKSSNDSNKFSNDSNSNWRNWSEPKKFFLLDLNWSRSVGNGSTCKVVHIWSPSRLFVQFEQDFEDLKKLEREIGVHCATAGAIRRSPLVNQVILASNSTRSGDYFRAVVTKFSSKRPQVRYLDWGQEVTADLYDCCEIPEHLAMDFPIYGIELNICLPEELKDAIAMGKIMLKLEEAVIGNDFIVDELMESKPRGRWTGSLRLKDSNETYQSLIEKLLKNNDDLESERSKTDDPKSGIFMVEKFRTSPSFRDEADVDIQFMWSWKKLTLVAQEDRSNLEILQEAINRHVGQIEAMFRDPIQGEVLLAPYNDGVYYRAEVKKVDLPDVLVQFLDYGDSKNVPRSELRELNQEIYEHPIYGVTWTMPDIPDPSEDDDEKSIVIPELQAIADRGGPGQVQVDNCANSVWSGRLWVDQSHTWNEIAIKALGENVKET